MYEFMINNLQNGEKILWSGKPEKVKMMEGHFKAGLIARWIASSALLVFSVWYANTSLGGQGRNIAIIWSIVAVALAVTPVINNHKLKTKCSYYLTNQRAVILIAQNRTCIMKSRFLDEVKDLSFDNLSTDCGVVYIGEKTKRARNLSQYQSIGTSLPDTDLPLMFYSVDDPIALCNLIRDQVSGSQKLAG